MPFSAYLTVEGKVQGKINGSVTQKGRENSILVHSFDNEILVPQDPATGQVTGKRQHDPIVILKEIDKSSPLLWRALVNNEVLTTWVLDFWAPAAIAAGPAPIAAGPAPIAAGPAPIAAGPAPIAAGPAPLVAGPALVAGTSAIVAGPTVIAAGTEAKIYSVSLTNAIIVSIHEFMDDNELPANTGLPLQEEIAFTYQKIQWTWTDSGITASDDWLASS
jgi:type VI secretion system secreted protein Hcp